MSAAMFFSSGGTFELVTNETMFLQLIIGFVLLIGFVVRTVDCNLRRKPTDHLRRLAMNSIIQIGFVLAAIALLVGLRLLHGRNKAVLLWIGIGAALLVGFRILGGISTRNGHEWFRTLEMENVEAGDQLALQNQAPSMSRKMRW
ncbi:MAG: hypothetical protein MZU84_07425 [Sphingobacterium sp.]|nr:hypothetical protein [Sphingobacterium sp.]